MPKPTATGRSVYLRRRPTSCGASSGICCRAPVTPVRETAYTNPVDAWAICLSRASVLVGAARKTVANARFCISDKYSRDSSTGKSVINAPSTQASWAAALNLAIPIRRIGFR